MDKLKVADEIPKIVPEQEIDCDVMKLTARQLIARDTKIEENSQNLKHFQYG